MQRRFKFIIHKINLIAFPLIILLFFHKVFLGYLPIPVDIMAGGYFPWLDYKWGYNVGVPVTNPSLSDVFAHLYPLRALSIDLIKSFELPLWNMYSFSGTPLLANWQSAPLYPLNLLMIIFGNGIGWSLMIIFQVFASLLFMYLYLRNKQFEIFTSIAASSVFAFSGFMTNYMQYATIGQAFLWVPLVLFLIDKFFETNRLIYIYFLPLIIYFVITAGSFQAAFYALALVVVSTLNSLLNYKKNLASKEMIVIFLGLLVGLLISAIQLIPTFELLNLSIRAADQNIIEYKYGLLPAQNLLTFISPDFFGNPATGNFWGFMGYQETAGYFGATSLIFVILALWIIIKEKKKNYYVVAGIFLITLILVIDNPISRMTYQLKVPVFSTSYATRMLLFVTFSAAILTAVGLNNLTKYRKTAMAVTLVTLSLLVVVLVYLFINIQMSSASGKDEVRQVENLKVALKNTVVPTGLIALMLISQILIKRKVFLMVILGFLIVIDNFRFSYKVMDFSKANLLYPTTPAIEFIQQNIGYFRFDREKSEVFPPNSWIPYKLMSPSGYDPLYPKQYAQFYNVYNNNDPLGGVSRYAELDQYNSPFTDLAGVKYLMVARRDKEGVIKREAETISYKINEDKYKRVFEDKTTIILENPDVLPRVNFYQNFEVEADSIKALRKLRAGFNFKQAVILDKTPNIKPSNVREDASLKIKGYRANKVVIESNSKGDGVVMLTDTYYPGWKVYVDNKESELFLANGIFRAVGVTAGKHNIEFKYQPESFKLGAIISAFSFIFWLVLIYINKIKKLY